jgi:hypothetical protein
MKVIMHKPCTGSFDENSRILYAWCSHPCTTSSRLSASVRYLAFVACGASNFEKSKTLLLLTLVLLGVPEASNGHC